MVLITIVTGAYKPNLLLGGTTLYRSRFASQLTRRYVAHPSITGTIRRVYIYIYIILRIEEPSDFETHFHI